MKQKSLPTILFFVVQYTLLTVSLFFSKDIIAQQVYIDESIDGQIIISDTIGCIALQETFKGKENYFSLSSFNNGSYCYKIVSIKNMTGNTGKLTVYR